MSRTPKNLPAIQDKRAEVVRLRAQGCTWDQIAAETGYANGSGALKAWRKAIAQAPNLAVTEIRAAEAARLEAMDAKLAEIIANPPVQHSAIGKVVIDPRTGEPALNPVPVIAALRERRMVGESYRRLTSADAPPLAPVPPADYLRAERVHQDLARQAPHVTRPPLPPGYSDMTPDQQLAAVIGRDRAHRDLMLAAIAAPRPGDDDIPEAEIVDD